MSVFQTRTTLSQALSTAPIDTLIFDMDGVITTEEKYWACARLTLWELVSETIGLTQAFDPAAIHNAEVREAVVPDKLIYALKSRAVNSNWDIAYVLACVYLTALPSAANLAMPSATVPQALAAIKANARIPTAWPEALSYFLENSGPIDGRALIELAGARFQTAFGLTEARTWQP